MLELARSLSQTAASGAIRQIDWIVPVLQTIHILAIAVVVSSTLMISLRVLRTAGPQTPSFADTTRRFEPWIWAGLVCLAASGLPLIVAEPQRTLPNTVFQIKVVLIALAITATFALCSALRRSSAARSAKLLAVAVLLLWGAVATAGRFIAYTQPG